MNFSFHFSLISALVKVLQFIFNMVKIDEFAVERVRLSETNIVFFHANRVVVDG